MGLGSIFRGVGKLIRGGGRLLPKIVKPMARIFGNISPIVRTGFEIASKIPQVIDFIKGRKNEVSDKINNIVNQLPNSNIKDKIKDAVNRGNNLADKVIDRGRQISDRVMPWVDAGNKIISNNS